MKTIHLFSISLIFLFGITSCDTPANTDAVTEKMDPNPPAAGFDVDGSDAKAIAIADKVMEAMGGRKNWDKTQFISWDFFGARHLTWDKKNGRVRIQAKDSTIYQINIFEDKGQIMKDGVEMTEADSIAKYVGRGKSIWINDSYWLVMPFKLKDSGVRLKYLKETEMEGGKIADVLELTFKNVGDTPDNKYLVYVDREDNLIKQWDFFRDAQDEEPRFTNPWNNYEKHGAILLSGDRGKRQLSAIKVTDHLPDSVFTSFSYY